jgi:DNA-directed RNA polymerase subunit N (RpoN/RPB10)
MAVPVRCDICGKLFSSRHVSSHKRLAHAKDKLTGSAAAKNKVKTILELFKALSAENKAEVLAQLADIGQEAS